MPQPFYFLFYYIQRRKKVKDGPPRIDRSEFSLYTIWRKKEAMEMDLAEYLPFFS